ncbi:hypothetical protein [Serratia marcescens]|uniref:Uncharacterized protein n=1 Tax=Serratia marcescens TaxID=615 RepID=A0AAP8PFY4_SERMA|nr:hypothetical protein [Serratia marcescens]PNO65047.1 hypothetical protein MC70_017750 [Serratia marcescens]
MSNESMYFDPSDFDFTSLVDVIEGDSMPEKPAAKLADVGPDGGAIDDISDLSDLFDTDEDAEEKATFDANQDASDLITSEVDPDKITLFNDLPDDAALSFDGHEMTKTQVKELFQAKQVFDEQRELVETAATSIDQIHNYIKRQAMTNQTAIDLNIQNLQRKLNSNISSTEYGEYSRQLNQAVEARNQLNANVDEQMRLLDVERYETTRFRLAETDRQMKSEIPQWDQVKGGLLQDLQKQGVNLGELEKVWNPQIAKMALDSYRYRKGREQVGAKALEAAKAKAPRSTSTPANAQRQNALDAKAAQKAALVKKAKSGAMTREDNAKMFDFLVD